MNEKRTTLITWDERLVRHAYEKACKSAARLLTYSYFVWPEQETPLSFRIDELAVDDLINFGISLRRLLDATQVHSEARSLMLPQVTLPESDDEREIGIVEDKNNQKSVWDILNLIIHSDYIYSLGSIYSVGIVLGYLRDDDSLSVRYLNYLLPSNDLDFPPKILLTSKHSTALFDLRAFLAIIEKDIFPLISEVCEKHGLQLEENETWQKRSVK